MPRGPPVGTAEAIRRALCAAPLALPPHASPGAAADPGPLRAHAHRATCLPHSGAELTWEGGGPSSESVWRSSSSSGGSGLPGGGRCHTMASWACSLRYRLVRSVRLTRLTTFLGEGRLRCGGDTIPRRLGGRLQRAPRALLTSAGQRRGGAPRGRDAALTRGCRRWRCGGAAESAGDRGRAGARRACASAPAVWPGPPRPRTRLGASERRGQGSPRPGPLPGGGGP